MAFLPADGFLKPFRSIIPRENYNNHKKYTAHSYKRIIQRGIKDIDIKNAISSAEKNGKVFIKTGKYGTKQKIYTGENGIVVIVETSGRNAGKVITSWRK